MADIREIDATTAVESMVAWLRGVTDGPGAKGRSFEDIVVLSTLIQIFERHRDEIIAMLSQDKILVSLEDTTPQSYCVVV